jgi:hypothetical protein
VDEAGELLLEDLDPLLNDDIRLDVASALHLKVEPTGYGVVVKWLALLWRIFPVGILALGPKFLLASSWLLLSAE